MSKQYRLYIAKKHNDGSRGAGWPSTREFESDADAIVIFRKYAKEQFLPTANEVRCCIYEGEDKRLVNEFAFHNPNPQPRSYKILAS